MTVTGRFAAILFAAAPCLFADSAALVRAAVERELAGVSQPRDYTYRYRDVERKLARDGSVRTTESKMFEVTILYGKQFTRLLERDGRPLAGAEQRKEEERFEREVAKRAKRSSSQQEQEDERVRAEDRERREFIRQIPDLYTFSAERVETVDGRSVWVIDAAPRKGARPRGFVAKNLAQLHGRLWIDQEELRWVRVEAEARQPISFGWCLGKVSEGSRIVLEQTRLAKDVWLPKRIAGRFLARLVVARFNLESETDFFDYRRFQVDSRVIPAAQ